MNVRQVPLGQSAFVMQPWSAFVPPTQLPLSHVPAVQSPSEQQVVLAGSGAEHRPVSLTQVPPGQAAALTAGQAPPVPVQSPPSLDPPLHRMGMRSAVRKSCELSGRLRPLVLPALQSDVPAASAESTLMTHELVAAPLCEALGTGSGGPNKHPAVVHCRNLHEPPGQSAPVVQVLWWFEPPAQRFPPASAGDRPLRVTVVPLHVVRLNDIP